MKRNVSLSAAELASLDLLITVAQQRGRGLDEVIVKHEEQAQAMADVHVAMWEARHGGLEMSGHDLAVIAQIRELASTIEFAPTLGQLLDLRGQFVNGE